METDSLTATMVLGTHGLLVARLAELGSPSHSERHDHVFIEALSHSEKRTPGAMLQSSLPKWMYDGAAGNNSAK